MESVYHFECGGFDELPKAVNYLISTVEKLTKTLKNGVEQTQNLEKSPEWMDVGELKKYLPDHPAKTTIYGWVSKKKIPHHKRAKSVYFLKTDIDEWLRDGRVKTDEELEREMNTRKQKGKG